MIVDLPDFGESAFTWEHAAVITKETYLETIQVQKQLATKLTRINICMAFTNQTLSHALLELSYLVLPVSQLSKLMYSFAPIDIQVGSCIFKHN